MSVLREAGNPATMSEAEHPGSEAILLSEFSFKSKKDYSNTTQASFTEADLLIETR